MQRPGEGVFERGSNVLDYWLAHSEGFAIERADGRRRVTAVVVDPDTRQARSLVVRRSRRRTQVVAADRVTAVDPHGRVLYLARRRRRTVAAPPVAATARRASLAARRTARDRLAPVASSCVQSARTNGTRWATTAGTWTSSSARDARARLVPLAAAYVHNARVVAVIVARRWRAGLIAYARAVRRLAGEARRIRIRPSRPGWRPSRRPSTR